MESLKPGRGMGHVLPEALAAAGVRATFLNHAENPLGVHELAATIARADEVGILTRRRARKVRVIVMGE